jgi:L-cystine uptake protein TcyP (sodium:dicarboxylate symporter family)
MIKKPNMALTVVFIIIIEGLAIYLNMVAHPQSQPWLTIFIVLLMALIFGFYVKYRSGKK